MARRPVARSDCVRNGAGSRAAAAGLWQAWGVNAFSPVTSPVPPSVIPDFAAARALFAPIAEEPVEVAAFAYLDDSGALLGLRQLRSTLVELVELSIREVVTDALALGATAVVMAHNHPSGEARPSPGDIAVTRRLSDALGALGIQLHDHLVVTPLRVSSFRQVGLL